MGSTSIRDRFDHPFGHRIPAGLVPRLHSPFVCWSKKADQGRKTHRSWSQSIQTGFLPSPLQSLNQRYEGTSQHVVGTGSHRSCTSTNVCTAGTALRCSEGSHPGTCGRTATYTAVRRLLLCLTYWALVCTLPDMRDSHVSWGQFCGETRSIGLINNRSVNLSPSGDLHQMTSKLSRNIQVQRIAYCSLVVWPPQHLEPTKA